MAKFVGPDYVATYSDDDETKQKVFDAVLEFFKKHESFNGESVMQSDAPQIHAAEFLADLADDILKFDVEWAD